MRGEILSFSWSNMKYNHDEIIKYLKEGLPYKEIASLCGCRTANVRYVARKIFTKEDRIERGAINSGPSVAVAAVDIKTGEIVKKFSSIGEADRWLGVNSKGNIGKILDKNNTYHGYKWRSL